jgi:glycerophosphoryl diester phosphodiesterase
MAGIIMLSLGCSSTRTSIIGHRGASFEAPENTVSSAKLAWEMGADAVEIDIHLTKDKKIIVLHDGSTKRTGDADMAVSVTNSDVLRNVDVGSFKDEKYSGEKIPFIEEIIETIPPKGLLFVEIKCGPEVLPYLKDIINNSGRKSRIVIIGFNLETMAESKKVMPDIPTYWLRGTVKDEETEEYLPHDPDWIFIAKGKKLDGLNLHYAGITEDFIKSGKEEGLGIYAWTVDSVNEAKRLKSIGIDGITTNKPDLMLKEIF